MITILNFGFKTSINTFKLFVGVNYKNVCNCLCKAIHGITVNHTTNGAPSGTVYYVLPNNNLCQSHEVVDIGQACDPLQVDLFTSLLV